MRFILNFVLFGLIFYGLFLYFPEAFERLSTWAKDFYDLFQSGHNTVPPAIPPK